MAMTELQAVTSEYKRQFIEDIMNEMQPYLDNTQLMELNRNLNYYTNNLTITNNPDNIDLDFEKTNTRLINQFIKSKKIKGCSTQTIEYYQSQLNIINDWSIKSFIEYGHEDLKEYLQWYESRNNCSKTTLDNTRRILSSFWKWMYVQEKIIFNPMERIPHIKIPKKVRKAFTPRDVSLLQDACSKTGNPLRSRAIIELLLTSGLRIGELVNLTIDDINFKECKGICMGKGHKERVFYFSERCRVYLEDYIDSRVDERKWLFVASISPYKKLGSNGVGIQISELGKIAGVTNTHPHRFRRTFATYLIRKGMPIEQVSKLLGHGDVGVTMRYVETDKELLKMVHNKHTN